MKFNIKKLGLSKILKIIWIPFSEVILLKFYIHFGTIFEIVIFKIYLFLVSFFPT